jgi:hypothetical protein
MPSLLICIERELASPTQQGDIQYTPSSNLKWQQGAVGSTSVIHLHFSLIWPPSL